MSIQKSSRLDQIIQKQIRRLGTIPQLFAVLDHVSNMSYGHPHEEDQGLAVECQGRDLFPILYGNALTRTCVSRTLANAAGEGGIVGVGWVGSARC